MDFKIVNRANVLVKKAYYTAERFDVKATFALLYHEMPLSVVELAKHVRVSDQLMSLDSNHFFIIFAFTEQDNAYKASQNIVYSLDSYFNNNTSCIALDAFNPSKSPQSVLNRLELILVETRKNPYIRIETEDILDRR
jgi:hypothetical protein